MLGKGAQAGGGHSPESLQLNRDDGLIPITTHCAVSVATRTRGQKEPFLLCRQRWMASWT